MESSGNRMGILCARASLLTKRAPALIEKLRLEGSQVLHWKFRKRSSSLIEKLRLRGFLLEIQRKKFFFGRKVEIRRFPSSPLEIQRKKSFSDRKVDTKDASFLCLELGCKVENLELRADSIREHLAPMALHV